MRRRKRLPPREPVLLRRIATHPLRVTVEQGRRLIGTMHYGPDGWVVEGNEERPHQCREDAIRTMMENG